ncbi:hypothetical protein HZA39_00850 [Candidatus Peregrinibacteria bacterium]|nr:hypothetical protein [Candidatus Peregrinibacteria bacterium]
MLETLQKVYSLETAAKRPNYAVLKYIFANILLVAAPIFLDHPQILTGTIVNLILIYIAVNFRRNALLPAVFLPSLAALAKGVLFGPFTIYLAIFAPFIWIANAIFIMAIRYFLMKNWRWIFTFGAGAILKAAFLFSVTLILMQFIKIPSVFLQAMGILQLGTALMAGVIYICANKARLFISEK